MLVLASFVAISIAGPRDSALPHHLRDTGLFVPGSMSVVQARNLPFSPQYPLWSDGASKRRWLYLPPGTFIDASKPDAWEFPRGTRLWKEFSHGRPIETRYIERLADGSWRYAAYVWNAQGTDAELAPAAGLASVLVDSAPGGRYTIPARSDCRACHEGAAVPVLGASALQLSPDRDPLAAHAEPVTATGLAGDNRLDLPTLVARGLLRQLAPALIAQPPRIAAATPVARAALGYLHANCGHCHNDSGPLASLQLELAQSAAPTASDAGSTLGSPISGPSRYRPAGSNAATERIVPGDGSHSLIAMRMRTRNPLTQMPPLGTQLIDSEGLALIERWIQHDLQPPKENTP